MLALEAVAVALGVMNGLILFVRPVARFHSRLDVIDVQLAQLGNAVQRIEKRLDREND